MKSKLLLKVFVVLFVFCSHWTIAQDIIVTVKVVDSKTSAPLSFASVGVQGTGSGGTTDNNGSVKLSVKPDAMLVISIVGYQTVTENVANRTSITVLLEVSAKSIDDVVVLGTRSAGRVKTETAVPVDVLKMSRVALPTGRTDLTSIINFSAPSLNYNKQTGSDGADHIDLATLRGLGPDQTLVLINGKRRHQTAFVAVFGTRGRGNSGTDMNAIPIAAIDRVEILRDGASAQYGSDAIAGVINLVLKKKVKQFTGDIGYSAYYDSKFNPAFEPGLGQYVYDTKLDGGAFTFNGNYGLPLGKNGGFLSLSGNFTHEGKTYRQDLDTSNLFTNPDALPINIYRRAHGDGSVNAGGGFLNSEIPVGAGKTRVYFFGGANYSASDAYAFTRNFSARPDRFPTDEDGNLIEVPGIIMTSADGEKYFNPHIQTHVTDLSMALGLRGETAGRWHWDFSNNTGRNDFHFYGDETFNASLGATQTHFDDGGFSFLQNTTNVDFHKPIEGIAQGFNFAAGAEFRFEQYNLYAGEPASYTNYDTTGEKATGSQGFPGYQPNDEVTANRSTIGAYVDVELDITKRWLVEGAVRVENYSDFGFTPNFKIATRVKAADRFNIRGSFSTGFRAPSLQQINFSSTFTTVTGGTITEVKIAPNYSPITRAAGIPELKQETAVNGSLGFAWNPVTDLNITVDGYWVQVKDRVVLSGAFSVDDPTLDPELQQALADLNVSQAQFFANAVNTTNMGIDLVLDYDHKWGDQNFRILLAGNIQKMTLDQINFPDKLNDNDAHRQNFLSDREQAFILASAPKQKFALNLEYGIRKFTVGARFTYFGEVIILGYGEDGLGINPMVPTDADPYVYVPDRYVYGGKVVTDLYIGFKITKNLNLNIGADNLFNVHPDLGVVQSAKYWAFNNETGGPWDAVQMGGNGFQFFARLGLSF